MKIVIATPLYPPEIGGPATYSALLERELQVRGFTIELVKFSTVRHLPKIIRHFKYAWLVYRAARRADIVYALDPLSVGLPALLAARLARCRFLLRVAGDYAWEQGVQRFGVTDKLDDFAGRLRGFGLLVYFLKLIQTGVANRAEVVIVPSNYFKGILEKWGLSSEKIKVIYSVFEGHKQTNSREDLRQKLGLSGFTVVSAGRLVPWKGFEELIHVVVNLRKILPDISLRLAGGGPDEEKLQNLVKILSADSFVHLLGELSQSQLYEELVAADLFVLNTSYEGLSHQILEAMDAGLPVVTTMVGGNPEIITSGESGVLVQAGDLAELESAVLWLAKKGDDRIRFVGAGKNVLKKFTVETMMIELEKIFKLQ